MLNTKGLLYQYSAAVSVSVPDLTLPQGGVLLLRGDSGSGKSTFLALACGLLTPSGGSITVAGQDVADLRGAARDAWRGRQVGFLPQGLHLSASLSVVDNLALAYFAAGVHHNQAHIARCLDALGVGDLAKRMPHELSGGQAQRVALARAVLLSPKIILADEPTASLDDTAAAQAIALLVQQAQRCGASLVVATHDARVSSALAADVHANELQMVHLSKINKQNDQMPAQNMREQL